MSSVRLVFLLALALTAFAANSVLCRLALHHYQTDELGFTVIRLLSACLTLVILMLPGLKQRPRLLGGSAQASLMLLVYMFGFSLAYTQLDTGMGALILFMTVQLTMLGVSWYRGQKFNRLQSAGLVLALAGLILLLTPTDSSTGLSMSGFGLMILAGVGWGGYSLSGQHSRAPLWDTGSNFLRTLPWVVLLLVFISPFEGLSGEGLTLAILSGALASGIGYSIWYQVLPYLSGSTAGVIQLLVPVIASLGGVVFSDEILSLVLVLSSVLILSGIGIIILFKDRIRELGRDNNLQG